MFSMTSRGFDGVFWNVPGPLLNKITPLKGEIHAPVTFERLRVSFLATWSSVSVDRERDRFWARTHKNSMEVGHKMSQQ